MARLINAENYRNLFNEEFKKTMALIHKGETHLDNLAEGFTEADRVIRALPTIDPVHAADGCYCEECTHLLRSNSSTEYHLCMRSRWPQKVDLDDFCSCGEKRDIDENTHSSV